MREGMDFKYLYKDQYLNPYSKNDSRVLNTIQKLFDEFNQEAEFIVNPDYLKNTKYLEEIALYIRNSFQTVIFIGMGASISIPMAMGCLHKKDDQVNIIYINTIESESIELLTGNIDLTKAVFIVVSKSGETVETCSLFYIYLTKLRELHIPKIKERFYFILGMEESVLRIEARKLGSVIFNHGNFSGRYSIFDTLGIFSALVSALDIQKLKKGAFTILEDMKHRGEKSIIARSAHFYLSMFIKGIRNSVYISYLERLNRFLEWNSQLLAESLSSNGIGFTPIISQGVRDHHSHLQLFLDGPRDKFFTMLYKTSFDSNVKISSMNNIDLSSILETSIKSVLESMIKAGIFVRTISFFKLNEITLGSMIMHFMLEKYVIGKVLMTDPLEQNAVNMLKKMIHDHYNN